MNRYIDADKLIEFANNTKDKTIDANDIARFPAADVRENVRGKWKIYCDDKGIVQDCYCDQCGFNSVIGGNFCPHCGADMRGEQK